MWFLWVSLNDSLVHSLKPGEVLLEYAILDIQVFDDDPDLIKLIIKELNFKVNFRLHLR